MGSSPKNVNFSESLPYSVVLLCSQQLTGSLKAAAEVLQGIFDKSTCQCHQTTDFIIFDG